MLNVSKTKEYLSSFAFKKLFIEELGWSNPVNFAEAKFSAGGLKNISKLMIAELAGVAVYEIRTENGQIPNAEERKEIQKEISKFSFENLLIFLDREGTQSLWYWIKREDKKQYVRDHLYIKGQPGDLFLNKLSGMVVDIGDFDSTGNISVLEVANRLKKSLDIEKVTKKFYNEFKDEKTKFTELINGIQDERDRNWYASILLNRLMFVYFLQKKGFIDRGKQNYLTDKLEESKKKGIDLYYKLFLEYLFFEGFAKEKNERSKEAAAVLGEIKYLNGGLFLRHRIEKENEIQIPDKAFEIVFQLFGKYSWHLDDSPGGKDDEINPAVLGYIFEKYINQKEFGAYYTRTEITDYLAERTIHKSLLQKIREKNPQIKTETLSEVIMKLDDTLALFLLNEILPFLSVLDPACGSGAFLVAAMKILIDIYSAVIGRVKLSKNPELKQWLTTVEKEHPSLLYYIKKKIITDNLYGVDIMEEAVEIARLRLFLSLAASANTLDELEPLPNIDFNVLAGNSLIGLIQVDEHKFDELKGGKLQGLLFQKELSDKYKKLLEEKNKAIADYKRSSFLKDKEVLYHNYSVENLKQYTEDAIRKGYSKLNEMLLQEFHDLKIQYEEATWDEKKNTEGKSTKRSLTVQDMEVLRPFHWGYMFDEIFARGGFDCILTNPPWEIFKPNSKEFFLEYSELVSRNKMDIKSFEKEKDKLLKDKDLRKAWLEYLSSFPHISSYFRTTSSYKNQISIVNDKKAGTDINLYKLFTEQCFNLLKSSGDCGIVIPSGIYTDLGSKQLREMLFSQCSIDRLYGLSNEKFIFENVDHRFKFCILTFEKGIKKESFESTFRINTREAIRPDGLAEFFITKEILNTLSINLIRKLSPDSLSIMEFQSEIDIIIAQKMLKYPLLGEEKDNAWNLKLGNEFHMTNDSYLFKEKPGENKLPLYEGKMIWQFDSNFSVPRYWILEKEGRKELLNSRVRKIAALAGNADKKIEYSEININFDYQNYRIGFRDIASSTNERAMISSIIPKNVFCGNTLNLQLAIYDKIENNEWVQHKKISNAVSLFLVSLFNSFILDSMIRKKITSHLNMFYIYQLPVPRLSEKSTGQEKKVFDSLVERAAKLICTTEEFADLWKEVMGMKWTKKSGVTEEKERAKLRAEIDAIVAHLYGITEEEFVHILSTFPLVKEDIKKLTLEKFRKEAGR